MANLRVAILSVAATLMSGLIATVGLAETPDSTSLSAPPVETRIDGNAPSIRATTPGGFGLKVPEPRSTEGLPLPFRLRFSYETQTMMMPLDQHYSWGIGLNFDLNSPRMVEIAPPSALGLQPKRTPGLTLQKRF